jgi:type II secretory pathway predicted ATPase ExeA
MYTAFFGFTERPFDLTPNPKFLFLAPGHDEALSTLRFGLSTHSGLTLLLGEAGTGKTTLVHAALAELNEDPNTQVEAVLLSNPTLSRDEFYEFLSESFDVGTTTSKTRFLFSLREHLVARHERGYKTALLLDEAQSLPYDLLEEVRLLSNLETDTVKLLNVVLAGQPELAGRLNEPNLRQLKQRIALRCALTPLSLSHTASYIAGRIRVAGGTPMNVFTREAISAIYAASGGLPRVINVICQNALIGGFAAQVRPVSRAIVEEVCRDFDVRSGPHLERSNDPDAGQPAPADNGAESRPGTDPKQSQSSSMFGLMNRRSRSSFF